MLYKIWDGMSTNRSWKQEEVDAELNRDARPIG